MRKGGEQKQPSLQHLAVTVKIHILGQILAKSATKSTNTLENVHTKYNKYIVYLFSETLGLGAENYPVKSSISDQCFFYVKYYTSQTHQLEHVLFKFLGERHL